MKLGARKHADSASMWETFRAIAFKEFLQLFREPQFVQGLLLWQVVSGIIMASVDPVIRNVPTIVVDQDRTSESRDLVARLEATRTFDVRFTTDSKEQARGEVRAGRAAVAVVIPTDYGKERTAGREAHVLALVDGSDSTSSAQAIATLQGVTDRLTEEEIERDDQEAPSLFPHVDILFNPEKLVSLFTLPGALAMALGLVYASKVARSIARERSQGTLERLLMSPMSYNGFILGKLVPWFVIAVMNGIVYLLVMRWLVGVPIRGSVLLLLGCMVAYVLTILTLGAFVGATSAVNEASWNLGALSQPAVLLSGYVLPLFSLPKLLLPIAWALPQTHFIEIARAICIRGATAGDLVPHLLYLTIVPLLFTLGAARRFARAASI